MCRAVHARLTAEEDKAVAKWTGVMIPVYASIVLVAFTAVLLMQPPRQSGPTAVAAAPERAR